MLNTAVNRVANGRRLVARRVVMNTLASVQAQIWRKNIIYDNADISEPLDPLSFEALAVSQQDEPNYSYEYIGMAYILADKFNGGYVHKNFSMVNPDDVAIFAQIEPYDSSYEQISDQITKIPDFTLNEGDLLGLSVYQDFMVWFEIVSITGQTIMADFGTKFILNRRDDLQLDPIKE
ncbi:hypothetical protein GCM10023206_06980 [Acinetobacter puyangensis]|uniref:Uncharacterized protein n=1 Tax=Acinetobacter puyangensis TaxID=1096779 RepID=A0A240E6J4_9GAMM|nr:hypothetical protein [Acinetobacter puyangensis]SNX44222.1 hypothetical protein SAMN05421731_102383 [Acinetobacter puyangensis]